MVSSAVLWSKETQGPSSFSLLRSVGTVRPPTKAAYQELPALLPDARGRYPTVYNGFCEGLEENRPKLRRQSYTGPLPNLANLPKATLQNSKCLLHCNPCPGVRPVVALLCRCCRITHWGHQKWLQRV